MKTVFTLFPFVAAASLADSAPPPPPVVTAALRLNPFETHSYAQKPITGLQPLVTPEQAQAIIGKDLLLGVP